MRTLLLIGALLAALPSLADEPDGGGGAADAGAADAGTLAKEAAFPELPQSPAFDALGANPTDVMRPTAIRELGLDLATAVDSSGTLKPGFALELAPVWLATGGAVTLQQWRDSWPARLASWFSVSLATLAADDGGTGVAEGLRWVIHDGADPRFDAGLTACIDRALQKSFPDATAPAGQPPAHATPSPAGDVRLSSAANERLTACRKQSLQDFAGKTTFSAAVATALTQHIKQGDVFPDDWARKADVWATAAVNGLVHTSQGSLSATSTARYEDGSGGRKAAALALRLRFGDLQKAASGDLSWSPTADASGWHDRVFTLAARVSWPLFEKLWVELAAGSSLGPDAQGKKPFGSLRLKMNAGAE